MPEIDCLLFDEIDKAVGRALENGVQWQMRNFNPFDLLSTQDVLNRSIGGYCTSTYGRCGTA